MDSKWCCIIRQCQCYYPVTSSPKYRLAYSTMLLLLSHIAYSLYNESINAQQRTSMKFVCIGSSGECPSKSTEFRSRTTLACCCFKRGPGCVAWRRRLNLGILVSQDNEHREQPISWHICHYVSFFLQSLFIAVKRIATAYTIWIEIGSVGIRKFTGSLLCRKLILNESDGIRRRRRVTVKGQELSKLPFWTSKSYVMVW